MQLTAAGSAQAVLLPGIALAGASQSLQTLQAVLSTKADDGARVAQERWQDQRTLDVGIASPITGEPVKWVRLLLPSGWTRDATATWPTLYLLHGGVAGYTIYSDNSDVAKLSADSSAIIAIPDTNGCSSYSDWYNAGKSGPPEWETYLTTELPQLLERGYHASGVRAVAGYSMGGQGALKLAENHPGLYRATASWSGDLDPLRTPDGGLAGTAIDTPGLICGKGFSAIWGDPKVPAQRAIWERNDPYLNAAKLAGTRVFLSAGDSGGFQENLAQPTTAATSDKLASLSPPVPHTYCLFKGYSHDWTDWKRAMAAAWPLLMSSIGATPAGEVTDTDCVTRPAAVPAASDAR
ncbi:esterase family protein [Frankia sp. AiPa1]|nr:esterase family protein [Frankia sp. AiPa1]